MPTTATPFTDLRVEHAMHRGIVTAPVDATVAEVAATMSAGRMHCVVVAGIERRAGGDHLTWGVLSDLDLMAAVASGDLRTRAGALAATDATTITETDTLTEAARIMAEHQITHLVVVEAAADRPTGVLSTLDVATAVARAER